jgi:hypothetical protein
MRRPSAATVVSMVALFVALSGSSYAALKANSIGAKQIKSNAVGTSELKEGSVKSDEVGDGTITGADIANESVGTQDVAGLGSGDVADDSLGSGDVSDGSLTGADVQDDSLGSSDVDGIAGTDIADGSVGSADVEGLQNGDLGSGQSVAAFARLEPNGSLAGGAAKNQGITAANVQHEDTPATSDANTSPTGPGIYCFGGLGFEVRSVNVTLDNTDSLPAVPSLTGGSLNFIPSVAAFKGEDLGRCDAAHGQVRVAIEQVDQTNAPTLANHAFYIQFLK